MVEAAHIQPELLGLLARQLDRCGPANLTVAACSPCPPFPADNSLLLLLAGAVAGFCLGVACTLLWTFVVEVCPTAPRPQPLASPALPALGSPAPTASLESSPATIGRRRAAPGSLVNALRDA